MQEVAKRELLSPEGIRCLRVTFTTRRQSRFRKTSNVTGWAYLRGYTMQVNLPHPLGVPADPAEVAWVMAHELAHCQGVRHGKSMTAAYGWGAFRKGGWDWAKTFVLELKPEPAPMKKAGDSEKSGRCLEMVETWERKAKFAKTKLSLWKRRLKYYERKMAAIKLPAVTECEGAHEVQVQ